MKNNYISKVFYAGAGGKSRRTIIPLDLAELCDITNESRLSWSFEFRDGQPVLIVTPLNEEEEEREEQYDSNKK